LIGTLRQNNPICSGLVISSPVSVGKRRHSTLPDDFSQLPCIGKQVSQASIVGRIHIPEIGFSKQHSQAKPIKDALISADSLKT
jgi:Ser-tRNA(Ala) deacylase AlaX